MNGIDDDIIEETEKVRGNARTKRNRKRFWIGGAAFAGLFCRSASGGISGAGSRAGSRVRTIRSSCRSGSSGVTVRYAEGAEGTGRDIQQQQSDRAYRRRAVYLS